MNVTIFDGTYCPLDLYRRMRDGAGGRPNDLFADYTNGGEGSAERLVALAAAVFWKDSTPTAEEAAARFNRFNLFLDALIRYAEPVADLIAAGVNVPVTDYGLLCGLWFHRGRITNRGPSVNDPDTLTAQLLASLPPV